MDAPGRRYAYALAALTFAGAALRFSSLGLQSLWFDEAVTAELVGMDLGGMLERIPDRESTPPLYYLTAWGWTRLFGAGEVGLRSLSALCGTLAIPMFWGAARRLTRSQPVAIAVAALVTFNPLLVWYSQEARAYSMLVLAAAAALLFFARLLDDPADRRSLAGWAIASALSLLVHYFALFVVVPQAVWLVARPGGRRRAAVAVGAVAAVGAGLLPLALHQRSLDLASFIRSEALPLRAVRSGKQFLTGYDVPLELPLSLLAGAIAMTGAVLALRRRPYGVVPAAILGGLACAVPLVLALVGLDYFDTRNLLAAWLPLATVVAAGLAASRPGLAGLAALCAIGLAGVLGVILEPLHRRDDWRGVARALGPARVPRAVVLTPASGGEVPFRHYRPKAARWKGDLVSVREVALVSTAPAAQAASKTPPPRPRHPVFPGFREVRRTYADAYTVIVLRAPRPKAIGRVGTAVRRLLPKERAVLLLQRPG